MNAKEIKRNISHIQERLEKGTREDQNIALTREVWLRILTLLERDAEAKQSMEDSQELLGVQDAIARIRAMAPSSTQSEFANDFLLSLQFLLDLVEQLQEAVIQLQKAEVKRNTFAITERSQS